MERSSEGSYVMRHHQPESVRVHHPTRREAMAALGAAGALSMSPGLRELIADEKRRFRIGACDWSIGHRGNPAALKLAKQIGLDGVQVSFGRPGGKHDLRKADVRREYAEAAEKHGVDIASLAMGVLNSVPYATAPEAQQWVRDCVKIMPKMNERIVLLAFFGKGDIHNKPKLQDKVIKRLKEVAPLAEDNGVVLGIESWMNADEHLRILDAVGSPSVQVYYDVANSNRKGYDIYQEIRRIGADRICEMHMKENGHLLGHGKVDFHRVKKAVDDIGYRGWLVIESATEKGRSVKDCYVHNQKYLRSIFPTAD